MMLAATWLLTMVLLVGNTVSAEGAMPMVHINCAVITVA